MAQGAGGGGGGGYELTEKVLLERPAQGNEPAGGSGARGRFGGSRSRETGGGWCGWVFPLVQLVSLDLRLNFGLGTRRRQEEGWDGGGGSGGLAPRGGNARLGGWGAGWGSPHPVSPPAPAAPRAPASSPGRAAVLLYLLLALAVVVIVSLSAASLRRGE